MQFHPKNSRKSNIDITPMIDVIFLLLLFFIVATTLEKTPSIKVILPQSQKSDETPLLQPAQVTLTKEGKIYLGDRPVNRKSLVATLSRLSDSLKRNPLVIRAEGLAAHKEVVFVMDAAKQAGFRRLSIATSKEK